MLKSKILIIEDDKDLNELLSLKLKSKAYEVYSLFDFEGIEELLDATDFDIVIADRNLPSGDFVRKLTELRKQGYKEVVILLTAKALHKDMLDGFEYGCDDYICKPFDFNELYLRIKAILNRQNKALEKLYFKDFTLNLKSYEFFYLKQKIEISNLDFELLQCFFHYPNTLLTRQFLSENVWKDDSTNDKTINIALTRLKTKIPMLKPYIQSIRGIGYKLC